MATNSSTQVGQGAEGSSWTSTVDLDTNTGAKTASVTYNTPNGSKTLTGTPESVSTQLGALMTKNAAFPNYVQLLRAAQSALLNLSATLTSEYQQLVPPPNAEPTPPASNDPTGQFADQNFGGGEEPAYPTAGGPTGQFSDQNMGGGDDLGGTSGDEEYSYDKSYAAKIDATKNVTNPNNEMETQNESYAGTTVAGQGDKGSANKVKSTEIASGPKPGARPQNPLGSLSSYTYQITLYMITPDAYDAFIQSGRNNINAINNAANPQVATQVEESSSGAYIIAQSGGINNKTSKRAFDLDFYIDDLKIHTTTNAKAKKTSSNDTEMSFNIYEPYGFSFITKLNNAAALLKKKSKLKDYKNLSNSTKQFFVLGIRFQGYDENGKEISAASTYNQDTFDVTGDSGGVFERFFDIRITDMKFKIDGKMTVYNITAATVAPKAGFGVKYGRIDRGAKVEGSTVEDVLRGTKGLLTTLNEQQVLQAKKNGEGSIPNVYKLRYLGTAEAEIGAASIVSIADLDKSKLPMSAAENIKQVNEAVSVSAVPDTNRRTITFANDVSIMQAIGSIISQSSYLENALTQVIKSDTEPPKPGQGSETVKDPKPKTIKWYNLGSEIKCLGFDTIVGDFAYEITYVIQPYETPMITSPYAGKTSKYYGAHKRYEYWFTGKNSEILHYEQTMDNSYFLPAMNPTGSDASQGGGADIATVPGKRQNEDRTGKLDIGKEAQNSYLTSLYDPGAFATAKVTILGDPDYLMQDSPSSINQVYRQFYGKGFTINPNGGQVFIEIDFKEAEDYHNDDGLLSINDSILFWKYPKEIASQIKGVSYMLTEVVSSFSKGKFTQELDCVINQFTDSQNKSDKNAAGRPTSEETTATTATKATDASGRRTGATDPRVSQTNLNPNTNSDPNTNIGADIQDSGGSGAGANNTNKSLNSGSEARDDGIIDAKKQPANQGGREEPVAGRPRGGA